MTTFNDLVKTLGGVPISPGFPFSKDANYFFVDPANGSSSGTGAFDDPCDKVSTAFALCTANQHDTVIYIAGSSGCTETAVIDWNLNYTHLIGIAAPSRAGKRARIFQGASLASTPFITVSATGCIFKDLYIFSGVADAAALISVKVTGGRNYFENVHFAGGGTHRRPRWILCSNCRRVWPFLVARLSCKTALLMARTIGMTRIEGLCLLPQEPSRLGVTLVCWRLWRLHKQRGNE
jgi:hypothetical protein